MSDSAKNSPFDQILNELESINKQSESLLKGTRMIIGRLNGMENSKPTVGDPVNDVEMEKPFIEEVFTLIKDIRLKQEYIGTLTSELISIVGCKL